MNELLHLVLCLLQFLQNCILLQLPFRSILLELEHVLRSLLFSLLSFGLLLIQSLPVCVLFLIELLVEILYSAISFSLQLINFLLESAFTFLHLLNSFL